MLGPTRIRKGAGHEDRRHHLHHSSASSRWRTAASATRGRRPSSTSDRSRRQTRGARRFRSRPCSERWRSSVGSPWWWPARGAADPRDPGRPRQLAWCRAAGARAACTAAPSSPGLPIQDDGDRDAAHELGHGRLGAEGVHERSRALSDGRMRGAMPPPTYTPAVATVLQRQIARLCAIGLHEHLERRHALRAAPIGGRSRDACGQIARIVHLSHPCRRGWRGMVRLAVTKRCEPNASCVN
jgi:hypothetical protein